MDPDREQLDENAVAKELLKESLLSAPGPWEEPVPDDPEAQEKSLQQPIDLKVRNQDIEIFEKALKDIGFNFAALANKIHEFYGIAGKPKVVADMLHNKNTQKWLSLVTDVKHILTTYLYTLKPEKMGEDGLAGNSTPTAVEAGLPFEARHILQNNIAISIIYSKDERLQGLKDEAQRVISLFKSSQNLGQPEESALGKNKEFLDAKLELEKKYFRALYPELLAS
ncbi:hypothetical protein D4R52_00525 [bacterium]|nr:MAG: hypothetical protein D4R52_00525 [bacterium]